MIGLSTTYFGIRCNGIYDSVKAVNDLGFDTIELGAAHNFESNIIETLKKIKKDFSLQHFTLHGVFPPLKQKFWFNPSEGLIAKNKKVIEGFFSAAEIVEAELVSFHAGFKDKAIWQTGPGMMNAKFGKAFSHEKAIKNAFAVFALAQKLSEKAGIDFAIENQPNTEIERPLLVTAKDFQSVFDAFPDSGLLLDFGHALFSNSLQDLLQLKNNIKQLHVHWSKPLGKENTEDNHFAFSVADAGKLEQLSGIKQLEKIPLIFEHGLNVSMEQIAIEKSLLENFVEKNRVD